MKLLAWRENVAVLRAALWTLRAALVARRELRSRQFDTIELPEAPALPLPAERGVGAVLRRLPTTCLEDATIRQAWYAAQGYPRDVVIGVTAPSRKFHAHAWLEGDPPCHSHTFHELMRRSWRR